MLTFRGVELDGWVEVGKNIHYIDLLDSGGYRLWRIRGPNPHEYVFMPFDRDGSVHKHLPGYKCDSLLGAQCVLNELTSQGNSQVS